MIAIFNHRIVAVRRVDEIAGLHARAFARGRAAAKARAELSQIHRQAALPELFRAIVKVEDLSLTRTLVQQLIRRATSNSEVLP